MLGKELLKQETEILLELEETQMLRIVRIADWEVLTNGSDIHSASFLCI
jgi:hypothetical protein